MRVVLLGLSLLLPIGTQACPVLSGEWISSKEKFTSFNKKWANVEPQAWSFMLQTQGKEVVEFTADNQMLITTPEIALKMGEKTITLPASKERIAIKILGCTPDSTVIQYERYDKVHLTHMNFENQNVFWQYMGNPQQDGNSHIREFYVRKRE